MIRIANSPRHTSTAAVIEHWSHNRFRRFSRRSCSSRYSTLSRRRNTNRVRQCGHFTRSSSISTGTRADAHSDKECVAPRALVARELALGRLARLGRYGRIRHHERFHLRLGFPFVRLAVEFQRRRLDRRRCQLDRRNDEGDAAVRALRHQSHVRLLPLRANAPGDKETETPCCHRFESCRRPVIAPPAVGLSACRRAPARCPPSPGAVIVPSARRASRLPPFISYTLPSSRPGHCRRPPTDAPVSASGMVTDTAMGIAADRISRSASAGSAASSGF